jgi:hypothetical protein
MRAFDRKAKAVSKKNEAMHMTSNCLQLLRVAVISSLFIAAALSDAMANAVTE